ncbi:universal stress protein [Mesorhizobium sp. 10J20-29]
MKRQAFVPFVTYPQANSDAIAENAVRVAGHLGADLHAHAIDADIPDVSNALSTLLLDTPGMIRKAEAESRRRGKHLLSELAKWSKAAGVDLTTEEYAAPLALLGETAAMHARYFDIGLVGWEAGNETSAMTAEAMVFGSGRPTLLLPELWKVDVLDHVAIAWDGSRVAARAVADARPFLSRAVEISILTVVDEKPLGEDNSADRLAASLKRHGLNALTVPIHGQDSPIAETLQQTAIDRGAKLLVMGGYGHSRMRDFVLGGATRGILGDLLMPVMLSH